MADRPVPAADYVVHYKDCSRYNWHDPEAQCDGAHCHPDPPNPGYPPDLVEIWHGGLKVGDRVAVLDEALAMLAKILPSGVPNNVGVIREIRDGSAYIIFDDSGSEAPYPLTDCEPSG